MKNILPTHLKQFTWLTVLAFVLCGSMAQAQNEKFTLTNGTVYWMDANNVCDRTREYPMAFNHVTATDKWLEYHVFGREYTVTERLQMGTVYLRLDLSNPADPKIEARQVGTDNQGFDPYCVWSRTSRTGYYYQLWDNVRYYLVGTPNGVSIVARTGDAPLDNASNWYDWDFGAAIEVSPIVDGVAKTTDHWLYYNAASEKWLMSPNSYERPEVIQYTDYDDNPTVADANKKYYYGYYDSDRMIWLPYGNGALFLGVTQIDHNINITGDLGENVTFNSSDNDLRYGEESEVNITLSAATISTTVRPSYTEYIQETERCGVSMDWTRRTMDEFNYSGVPQTETHLYQNNTPITSIPTPTSKTLTPFRVIYELQPSLRHYLQMYETNPADATYKQLVVSNGNDPIAVGAGNVLAPIHLQGYSMPPQDVTGKLTAIITYRYEDNGEYFYVNDTLVKMVTASAYVPPHVDREPTVAPVIYGYVCGGGRMANVGEAHWTGESSNRSVAYSGGNPTIDVHNADSIYAIYGGNDIAGWTHGSVTIQIGHDCTYDSLRIGYIYGGGCGYYHYKNCWDANTRVYTDTLVRQIGYGQYCFGETATGNGKVYRWGSDGTDPADLVAEGFGYAPYVGSDFAHEEGGIGTEAAIAAHTYLNGTIPYIRAADIHIGITDAMAGNDHDKATERNTWIYIDSIFGGAENAFIGVDHDGTAATAIDLTVFGGTIMAVFGGNNYGGSVSEKSLVNLTIHDTKTKREFDINNSAFKGYGREFGIRNVFGGGNFVDGAYANVLITGGMIDTVFLGGNKATVTQPIGTVNCAGRHFIYENPYMEVLDTFLANGDVNPYYVNVKNKRALLDTQWENFKYQNPGSFNSEVGRYNVRVFYGGNNRAHMYNLSYVTLLSGGIGYVYGGGNMGDMKNSMPLTHPHYIRRDAGNNIIFNLADSVKNSLRDWIYPLPRVFGSMINAPESSHIIVENIYGGCRMANVDYSSGVSLSGGVFGYVHGGCDISGDVGSRYQNEGTWTILDSNAIVLQDIYGGSDGFYHCHNDNNHYTEEDVVDYNNESYDPFGEYVGLPAPTHNNTNLYIHGGTVLFSAYGGGVMCDVGFKDQLNYYIYDHVTGDSTLLAPYGGVKKGSIHFMINGGTIGSSLYHRNAPGTQYNTLDPDLQANHDGNVYGGGYLSSLHGLSYFYITSNLANDDWDYHYSISADSAVNSVAYPYPLYSSYQSYMAGPAGDTKIMGSVFAGNDCMGNTESFGRYSLPRSKGHPEGVTDLAFESSNDEKLNDPKPTGNALFDTYLLIQGKPQISCVYGSGNGEYVYSGPDRSLEVVCKNTNGDDDRPFQTSTYIDINTAGGFIDTVFGGGNGVGVKKTAEVLLNTQTLANADRVDNLFVGTIFGGNNRDEMKTCVPDIILQKGTVGNVFGGGNAGSMSFQKDVVDICGDTVKGISTYIKVASTDVKVINSIFGGCRIADVEHMAYIDIRNTEPTYGINSVYGGNDISGTVKGNTRIDVSGGKVQHIYGGSNGYYDYVPYVDGSGETHYSVWTYNSDHTQEVNMVAPASTGSPKVAETLVNLFGGEIASSVYGGGRMGDCERTKVVVNDKKCPRVLTEDDPATTDVDETTYQTLTINGVIYGGGEGDYQHLHFKDPNNANNWRFGNVTESCVVDLHHAENLSGAKAYGGGRGGDVYSTLITVYPEWEQPFDSIFGGCWGSDVYGTAHLVMNGSMSAGHKNARTVYGGNDFTGNVHTSIVDINSGRYENIFGGGNGAYPANCYNGALANGSIFGFTDIYEADYTTHPLKLPNNEYIIVNINGGEIENNSYGGGRLGTTMRMQRTAGLLITDADGNYLPDTNTTYLDYKTSLDAKEDYSYVITNMHGGYIGERLMGGGLGNGNAIVFGLKMVNMDGGEVAHSVHGGSWNAVDGYGNECSDKTHTSMRPTSIVNVTGGTIDQNVLGAGFLGAIHGSTYVNIGIKAIDSCVVWDNAYGTTGTPYAKFKPGAANGYVDALAVNSLNIRSSVYGGADYGTGEGELWFDHQGIWGGESRIIIDGDGYNTTDLPLPEMDIKGSVIGSGTSAEGGDVLRRIEIRNYGGIVNCNATKTLLSVQRADEFWLHNTGITYNGQVDAMGALISGNYSINRINTGVYARGFNLIDLNSQVNNVTSITFYQNAKDAGNNLVIQDNDGGQLTYTDNQGEDAMGHPTGICDTTVDHTCDMLEGVNPTTRPFTVIKVNNGVNIDIKNKIADATVYGGVTGYAYLVAQHGTNAVVSARSKYNSTREVSGETVSGNVSDGGFVAFCDKQNGYPSFTNQTSSDWGINWAGSFDVEGGEFPYHNYTNGVYRVWTLGQGYRYREAVVLAHAEPVKLTGLNTSLNVSVAGGANRKMALAVAELELPPSSPGHYYRFTAAGITASDDGNNLMHFTDSAWVPDNWTTPSSGRWYVLPGSGTKTGTKDISKYPGSTFGLILASGANFQTTDGINYGMPAPFTNDHAASEWTDKNGATVLWGNEHVNVDADYWSARVKDQGANMFPTMNVYMLYDSNFSTTMIGNVYFELEEYDAEGNVTGYPIQVKVTISTIVDEFSDMTQEVLALYNEGRRYEFVRKAVLPATLHNRVVYATGIEWAPADNSGISNIPDDFNGFTLTDNLSNVIGYCDRFTLSIEPNENISSSIESYIGWINKTDSPINLYTAVGKPTGSDTAGTPYAVSAGTISSPASVDLTENNTTRGMFVGELDGRGLAAIEVKMEYDGMKVFPDGVVGTAIVHLISYEGDTRKEPFDLIVNVKCRHTGDTIYLATAPTITRGGHTITQFNLENPSTEDAMMLYNGGVEVGNPNRIGKRPEHYLKTFQEVFNTENIYIEGDVIAILDTVKIPENIKVRIAGTDYAPVQVVRYDGHHSDLPDEEGVYRGTMIDVAGSNASFTTYCVTFDGQATSKVWYTSTPSGTRYLDPDYKESPNNKYLDTNIAFGPVLAVHGSNATLTLEGTTLCNNINMFDDDNHTMPTASDPAHRYRGAISVTEGGTLVLKNTVTIENNLTLNLTTPANASANPPTASIPDNGAVYVDNGYVKFDNMAHPKSKVTITNNYLADKTGTNDFSPSENYFTIVNNAATTPVPLRYEFDSTVYTNKANVFLTRIPNTGQPVLRDDSRENRRDLIQFSFIKEIPTASRVGVTRWFPGPTERDTIGIVLGTSSADMKITVDNNIFSSDEGYNIFTNEYISKYIYLQRCATFKHQSPSTPLPHAAMLTNSGIVPDSVLKFLPNREVICPVDGDTIEYRVQGGFFPYNYVWKKNGTTVNDYSTITVHNTMLNNISTQQYDEYASAIMSSIVVSPSDNFKTRHGSSYNEETLTYTVMATDAAGCNLMKKIEVLLKKDPVAIDPFVYYTTNPSTPDASNWVSTASPSTLETPTVDDADIAKVQRNYRSVQLTPVVWSKASSGTINAWVPTDGTGENTIKVDEETLAGLSFCPGEKILLSTQPSMSSTDMFIMWDFDPYYSPTARYIVPPHNTEVVAYYGPADYWKDVVNTTDIAGAAYDGNYTYTNRNGKSYVTTYNGDVHIYDENGLAWFISVVNGLNGTQAREFYFNKVYLHDKTGGYDMSAHLWTPVGTMQHPFRGWFQGVGSSDADTAASAEPVKISNIVLNEPDMGYVGFFGFLDTARVRSIKLDGAMVRGDQYVGTLAASARNTRMSNITVADSATTGSPVVTTIISTHHTSGGLIGTSEHTKATDVNVSAKYVGDAVYSGGVVGTGHLDTITNSFAYSKVRMSGLYYGNVAGKMEGSDYTPSFFGRKPSSPKAYIANNYLRIENDGQPQRIGGIVGHSENTVIENNYVYGLMEGTVTDGAIGATLGDGTSANNNYYEYGNIKRPYGTSANNVNAGTSAAFEGRGNRVNIDQQVYGVNNLTRVLNIWVRSHNEANGNNTFKTWRSDLDYVNNGYPIFGQPDMIPVESQMAIENCDTVEWEGVIYTNDTAFSINIVDSVQMVDSTMNLTVIVHHSVVTELNDSINMGEGYSEYGFYLTPAEVMLLRNSLERETDVAIVLNDTLQTEFGCDSIVSLTLVIRANGDIPEVITVPEVKVYPNPTTSFVTVEATDLKHVELYDNEGRRLSDYVDAAANKLTIGMERLASGIYYLRIHTADRVTIQKLIKK